LLDRYILLFKYIDQTINDLVNKNNNKKKYLEYQSQVLSEQELELAKIVRDLLKPFLFVTNLLSKENCTTLDLVAYATLYLRHKIASFTNDSELTPSVKCLLLNSFNFYIEKYAILTNPLLISATFLNPNYKSFKYSTSDEKTAFVSLYRDFLIKTWNSLKINTETIDSAKTDPLSAASHHSFFNDNSNNVKEYGTNTLENEIALYAADEYVDELSKYWNLRKTLYPCLFKLARVILCCPATSVPSERLFSNASDQIWAKRNRLSAFSFEKLMVIYSSLKI